MRRHIFVFAIALFVLLWVSEGFAQEPQNPLQLDDAVLTLGSSPAKEKTNDDKLTTEKVTVEQSDQYQWTPREVPTREEDGWKRLEENDTVPRGSHVRLNMTSGERWVKVGLSKGEQILELLSGLPDHELKERIDGIRRAGVPGSHEFENGARDLWNERQELLHVHHPNSTSNNSEQTLARVTVLSSKLTPATVTVEILEELEELVEDLDEAATFANEQHKGLQKCLVMIDTTETPKQIKTLAASVLGKAIKLTNDLQNLTISLGGFHVLNRALREGHIEENRAISSLGALVRGSEEAGKEALKHQDFFESMVRRLSKTTDTRIRQKVAALIGDLLMEPDEWCWMAFRTANLCHSSNDFGQDELKGNPHFRYLQEIRAQVCLVQDQL
jgi:hypothetical protein